MKEIAIVRISEFDSEAMNHLAEESLSQGFRFVDRLIREYSSGLNCFDRFGEMLLTASVQGAIVRFIPFEKGFSESVGKDRFKVCRDTVLHESLPYLNFKRQ